MTQDDLRQVARAAAIAAERAWLSRKPDAEPMGRAVADAVLEAIAQVSAEGRQTWQPIESAPKDGVPVRLKWDSTTVEAVGRWCPACEWPKPFASDDWRDVKGDDVLLMPTHWMPIHPPSVGRLPTQEEAEDLTLDQRIARAPNKRDTVRIVLELCWNLLGSYSKDEALRRVKALHLEFGGNQSSDVNSESAGRLPTTPEQIQNDVRLMTTPQLRAIVNARELGALPMKLHPSHVSDDGGRSCIRCSVVVPEIASELRCLYASSSPGPTTPEHHESCNALPHHNRHGVLVTGDCDCGAGLDRNEPIEEHQWCVNRGDSIISAPSSPGPTTPEPFCKYRGKGDPPQECDYPNCGCHPEAPASPSPSQSVEEAKKQALCDHRGSLCVDNYQRRCEECGFTFTPSYDRPARIVSLDALIQAVRSDCDLRRDGVLLEAQGRAALAEKELTALRATMQNRQVKGTNA